MVDKNSVINAFNTNSDMLIISSISKSVLDTSFTFRNYYYAITYISWKSAEEKKELYADTEYIIIMVDRIFILVNFEIRKIAIKILIRDLNSKIHHSNEYAILIFYIESILSNNTRAFTEIKREIYIIDDLKADILIRADILTPKRIALDFAT